MAKKFDEKEREFLSSETETSFRSPDVVVLAAPAVVSHCIDFILITNTAKYSGLRDGYERNHSTALHGVKAWSCASYIAFQVVLFRVIDRFRHFCRAATTFSYTVLHKWPARASPTKITPSPRGIWTTSNASFLGLTHSLPKRHVDRINRFCRATGYSWPTDGRTDRQTDRQDEPRHFSCRPTNRPIC